MQNKLNNKKSFYKFVKCFYKPKIILHIKDLNNKKIVNNM